MTSAGRCLSAFCLPETPVWLTMLSLSHAYNTPPLVHVARGVS